MKNLLIKTAFALGMARAFTPTANAQHLHRNLTIPGEKFGSAEPRVLAVSSREPYFEI